MSDKPALDFTMDDVFELVRLEPDKELYLGPLAITNRDIMERFHISRSAAREWADKAVMRGKMVEVWIPRPKGAKGSFERRAWVPTVVWEHWEREGRAVLEAATQEAKSI